MSLGSLLSIVIRFCTAQRQSSSNRLNHHLLHINVVTMVNGCQSSLIDDAIVISPNPNPCLHKPGRHNAAGTVWCHISSGLICKPFKMFHCKLRHCSLLAQPGTIRFLPSWHATRERVREIPKERERERWRENSPDPISGQSKPITVHKSMQFSHICLGGKGLVVHMIRLSEGVVGWAWNFFPDMTWPGKTIIPYHMRYGMMLWGQVVMQMRLDVSPPLLPAADPWALINMDALRE